MELLEKEMADRTKLKLDAYRAHTHWSNRRAKCPWCKGSIEHNQFELHEALVKRGEVPKDRQNELIFVLENTIPLHSHCHQDHGHSAEMKARALFALSNRLTAERVAKWYIGLWQEHGLSVPKGILIPKRKVPPYDYSRLANIGAAIESFELSAADWEVEIDGRKWDWRVCIGKRWAGAKGHSKIKPLKVFNGVRDTNMLSLINSGYWFSYLCGCIGFEPSDALETITYTPEETI